MTHSERSVIIGLWRMCESVELICFHTKIDGLEVEELIKNTFPPKIIYENQRHNTLKDFSRENTFCNA